MATDIQEIDDRNILVNEKLVLKNMDNDWEAKIELTAPEIRAFHNYLTAKKKRDTEQQQKHGAAS